MGSQSSKSEQVVSKKFLNNGGSHAVEEMLEGLVKTHPGQFCKLENLNVIVRSDFEGIKDSQVALISGGGSGHEPAHAGFCGSGMLTAAVCGGVFASPSMELVLQTIRTVTGPKGCLLIVKNYTGDRLNFGLAAEQAKSEGFKVEIVFVCDDAALSDKGVTGRRGLAGTVLVHKVAGAAAAKGLSLEEVKDAAESVASTVRTVGAALSVCNVPGKVLSDRLRADDGKMELGLGIHGEPGRERMDVLSTDKLVETICSIILEDFEKLNGKRPSQVALLLNNLGATTAVEMYGIANSLLSYFDKLEGITVERIYLGPLMTSLEMQGVSISVLGLDLSSFGTDSLLELLSAPSAALGWPASFYSYSASEDLKKKLNVAVAPEPSPETNERDRVPRLTADQVSILEKRMRAAANALIKNEPQLTAWDKICGDGDAGQTFEKGAKLVLAALDAGSIKLEYPDLVLHALAKEAQRMGGTSGAVLAIFFSACETKVKANESYGQALKAGTEAITRYGGATPGMRTMLDALDSMAQSWTSESSLEDLAKSAGKGADLTAFMKASAGRSNYIPDEHLYGVPDPGAKAVAFAMEAMASIASPP